MNDERALTILLKPHISEKSSQASGAYRLYAFKVIKDASKPEVKAAVEQLFKVNVRSVRILNVKSKPARFGRIQGRHKSWKKAYVALSIDQEIDIATGT
jgi:large subunit ribosomal protein L23